MATKRKSFDAVAESRKWRIASGKRLAEMTRDERLAYLTNDVAAKLEALRSRTPKTPRKLISGNKTGSPG